MQWRKFLINTWNQIQTKNSKKLTSFPKFNGVSQSISPALTRSKAGIVQVINSRSPRKNNKSQILSLCNWTNRKFQKKICALTFNVMILQKHCAQWLTNVPAWHSSFPKQGNLTLISMWVSTSLFSIGLARWEVREYNRPKVHSYCS